MQRQKSQVRQYLNGSFQQCTEMVCLDPKNSVSIFFYWNVWQLISWLVPSQLKFLYYIFGKTELDPSTNTPLNSVTRNFLNEMHIATTTNSASVPCTSAINSKWSVWSEPHATSQPLPALDHRYEQVDVYGGQNQQDTYYPLDPSYLLPNNLIQSQFNSPVSFDNCLSCDQEISVDPKLHCSNLNRITTNTQNVPNSASWSSITTSNSEVNFFLLWI